MRRLLKSETDPAPASAPPPPPPPDVATRDDPAVATRDDIAACFRLLLDRDPNPEELSGHMAQAGQPLGPVVAGYVNSLEFARRGLLRSTASPPVLVERDGYRLYARPDDAAVGRHVVHGSYEPEIEAIFRQLLRPGMGVVDLGANLGYFTMLAAHLVGPGGFVFAVEPNPDNVQLIEASRRLNGFAHVTVSQLAAGRRVELLMLNATHSNGTTSTIGAGLDQVLTARTVAAVPLDALIDENRRIDLVKIDVEGAEYNALLGAERLLARNRPVIVSEFSPGLLTDISRIDGPGYLAWLHRLGYDIAVVLPDGGLEAAGQDTARVMSAYAARGIDHIDLVATPR